MGTVFREFHGRLYC